MTSNWIYDTSKERERAMKNAAIAAERRKGQVPESRIVNGKLCTVYVTPKTQDDAKKRK